MTNDRNLDDQDVNAALRDLVREPATLPSDGLDEALAEVASTPQVHPRRWWWPLRRTTAPLPMQPETTLLPRDVAAVGQAATRPPVPARLPPIARLAVGVAFVALVAFFIGTWFPFDDAVVPPAASPSASPAATAQPSPAPIEAPSPRATGLPDTESSPLPAPLDPPTIIVDPSGAGDFESVAQAVAAAVDGDIIGVMPGIYEESLLIEKDIEIRGLGGDRSEVVIHITEASATVPIEDPQDIEDGDLPSPHAIRIVDTDASVNGLTIESLVQDGTGVVVEGGAPDLSDLAYVSEGENGGAFVGFGDGAGGTLRDSTSTGDISFSGGASTLVTGITLSPSPGQTAPVTWIDGRATTARFVGNRLSVVAIEGGSPTFESNDISGIDAYVDVGVAAWAGADSTATIRNNLIHDWSGSGVDVGGLFVIEGNTFRANAAGVVVGPGAAATVTGNTIEDSRGPGISSQAGSRVNIVGNVLRGNAIGIETTTDGSGDDLVPLGSAVLGIVDDNQLIDNTTAMDLDGSGQIISNNTITGGSNGIIVRGTSSPTLEGNAVSDTSGDGILIEAGSSTQVSGNSLCGNARNMTIEEGTQAEVRDNEYCAADGAAGNVGPASLDAGIAPKSCGPAQTCPLRGSGAFSASGVMRTTQLALATGSYFGGVAEPFRLILQNDDNAMIINGIGQPGSYRGDQGFSLEMRGPTIEAEVDTSQSSDCTIAIDRVDDASIAGTVSCEQHPSGSRVSTVVDDLDGLIDIDGEFSARATERGGASAWRGASFLAGFDGEMMSFDSEHLFEGWLDSMSAGFPDEPFELHYVDDQGATLTITGHTTPGSYPGDGDGFGLVFESAESPMYDTDSTRTRCQIDIDRADEDGIEGRWSCPVLGHAAGGWFTALP